MIDFKQYITELRGPKPANSNAQHDSDHDMVDVSDDSVVRKLNSFLGCIADMEHMLPEQTIGVVRRRLASIGLSFPNVDTATLICLLASLLKCRILSVAPFNSLRSFVSLLEFFNAIAISTL